MTTAAKPPREAKVPFSRSIQAKYALTYLLVVAAILIVMNTYPLLMVENMVFASKESTLKQQALVIGSALAVSETLTQEGVEQTMAVLEKAQGTRVLVADGTGRILYDSSTLDNRLGDYALMGEVVAALRGRDVARSEYREGAIRCRAAVPVLYHGVTLGAVYLYEYDAEQAQVLLSIQSNLRYISLVIGVAAMLLVLLFSKALTRNTGRLLSAIRRVREGEYSHRVDSRGRDEMAQLADEFNQLTDRLQTTEEARRRFVSDASHELKTPLASIRLLTDSILQNDSVDMGTVREFVSDIGEEADRLTRISEHLLALTRLDGGPGAGGAGGGGGEGGPYAQAAGPGHGGVAEHPDRAGLRPAGHGGRSLSGGLQPDGERHQVQSGRGPGGRYGAAPGGQGVPGGVRHRGGHTPGGYAQDLRPVLPGGQGPLPGGGGDGPGPVHRPGHRPPPRRGHQGGAQPGGEGRAVRGGVSRPEGGGQAMKKRIGAVLAAVLLLGLATACLAREERGEDGLLLWFAAPAEEQSQSVAAALSSCPYGGEDSVPALLAALLAGPPQDSGLARIIPAGTRLARWSVENRTALVELSPEYGGLEGIDRTLADYCVALTLCQLPAVDGVRLSAGGGEGRLLRAGDAIFSGAEEEPVDVTAALYFRRAGGNTLGYELRVFRLTEEETPARAVLEALISGPRDEGLSALLPPELTVRAAWVDDGVCYADLSGALLAAPPEQAEEQELLITSIVETLCSLDKVEQVRLLVEGEALTAYGGLDLSGPLLPAKPKDGFAGTPS